MQNPLDQRTTRAMVDYRMTQLRNDLSASRPAIDLDGQTVTLSDPQGVTRVRRSIGLSLIRLGSRLAGIRVQPRVSNQY